MSYRLEGKDIVIDGFDQGIADTPYKGIADMRNVEIISVPGEAMTTFETTPVAVPPAWNAKAFTAQASGDTITVDDTTGLYDGCAIVLNTNTAGGISTGTVYYVGDITATTFTLHLVPAVTDTDVDITSDGSGTLTTYQYGRQRATGGSNNPISWYADRVGYFAGVEALYLTDASNYGWVIFAQTVVNNPAYSLIFLGNIGGVGAGVGATSIVVWNDYVLLLGSSAIDIADVDDLMINDGPAMAWDYTWESISGGQVPRALVSQDDGNIYYISNTGLGSVSEEPGETFDPTDTSTYNITDDALLIPVTDNALCIAELGSYLYVGGQNSLVYPWDKVTPGFQQPLTVPETYIPYIVATHQDIYIFAGVKGRIYISNGASMQLWKKVPEYLTGIAQPFIRWRAAAYSRGEVLFSFTALNQSNTDQETVSGAWAVNVATQALRLIQKTTLSGYIGTVNMIVEVPSISPTVGTPINGNGLYLGWNNSTTSYGIDRPLGTPYDGGESFIETDMIPIGSYLSPFTPSQIEWKTSVPLGSGDTQESISIYYRSNLSDSFTPIGTSTSSDGTINGVEAISDLYEANFQKVQWVQFRIVLTSNATTPTYCRLTEIRVRDYPSAVDGEPQ